MSALGTMDHDDSALPPIPAKRYFTIGEVAELCLVKPYVLRYWEQEFVQLKPMKRRGNRRYYQHHEVLLIRRIRELLYEQGFTISGARNQLADMPAAALAQAGLDAGLPDDDDGQPVVPAGVWHASTPEHLRAARALQASSPAMLDAAWLGGPHLPDLDKLSPQSIAALREALLSIRDLLS